jgi:hypothetical protein
MGKLLGGDLVEQLGNIMVTVAYRIGIDREILQKYLGTDGKNADTLTSALESILQNSIIPDLERRIVPKLQLARFNMSWEDIEMYGNSNIWNRKESDWARKREEALNRGEQDPGEWPYDFVSEHWKQKMRDRYTVAMELKEALKEYREY